MAYVVAYWKGDGPGIAYTEVPADASASDYATLSYAMHTYVTRGWETVLLRYEPEAEREKTNHNAAGAACDRKRKAIAKAEAWCKAHGYPKGDDL